MSQFTWEGRRGRNRRRARSGKGIQKRSAACLEALEERMMLSGGLVAPIASVDDDVAVDEWSGALPVAVEASTEDGARGGGGAAPTGSGVSGGASGAPAANGRFLAHDRYDVSWPDAEKSPNNSDDDKMCWAAAASNVLEYTGWGFVDGMTNADEVFAYFQTHYSNAGGWSDGAWQFWFDIMSDPCTGARWETTSGGSFFPYEPEGAYGHVDEYIEGTPVTREAMAAIDEHLHAGHGVVLNVYDGDGHGHAITCWGYDYYTSPAGNVEYRGIWVTDSDDDKSDSTPEDELAYYDVQYNATKRRWDLEGGYNGWHIKSVMSLAPVPDAVLNTLAAPPDLYYRNDDASSPFSDNQVSSGDPWSCDVSIWNVGRGDAWPNVEVTFWASTDKVIDNYDHYLGRTWVEGVPARDSATATLVLERFPDLPASDYHVGMIIDPGNYATETHEANNRGVIQWADAVGNVLQDHKLSVLWPDLRYDGDSHSYLGSSTVAPGDSWTCCFSIRNNGPGDAAEFYVDFYASDNNVVSTRDHFLGRALVSGIEAGHRADAELNLASFPDLPSGDYYVGALIDPTAAVAETREINNVAVNNADGLLRVARPDLYHRSGSSTLSSTLVAPGQWWSGSFAIDNAGQVDAGGFYVDFYASANQTISTSDHFLGREWVAGIRAGDRGEVELNLEQFPANVPPGQYYVGIIIDPTDVVAESNEQTNNRGVNVHDGPLAVRWPDLYHDEQHSAGPGSTSVAAGDPWTCEFAVGNAGSDAQGDYQVLFIVSADEVFGPDDHLLGYDLLRGCSAGDVEFAHLSLDAFPETVAPGDYYVGILIDPLHAIPETDEANNVAFDTAHPIHVVAPSADGPRSLPYEEDFSDGLPSAGWEVPTNQDGQVEVVDGQLRMASASRGRYALNEAILHLDLAGAQGVRLELDHANRGDERHMAGLSAGETFKGSRNADLIAISDDGTDWYVLEVLAGSGHLSFDVDAAVRAAAMTYTRDFQIKFQQYDNYTWGSDGRAFDNVAVSARAPGVGVKGASPGQDASGLRRLSVGDLAGRSWMDFDWHGDPGGSRFDVNSGRLTSGGAHDVLASLSSVLTRRSFSSPSYKSAPITVGTGRLRDKDGVGSLTMPGFGQWDTTRYPPGAEAGTSGRSNSFGLHEDVGHVFGKGDGLDPSLDPGLDVDPIDLLTGRLALLLMR